MTMEQRIKHVKACSDLLNGLGYTNQCVDEFEGAVYLMGTNGYGFHMHKLYKVQGKGTAQSRRGRLSLAVLRYTNAFNMKDM